ncbi:MAG TPA: head GIN domain-containing protein [Flavisolibacter sp.]|nr:head GIN domain-containing protein [Flavisolibacter sp.]
MKKLFIAVSLLCVALVSGAQKVINDPNVELRTVAGAFNGIAVSSGIDLYLSQGDEVVAVSAERPEHLDRIKTEIVNGTLKIWYDAKSGININIGDAKRMRAYVSYKTLNSIKASSGSDVTVDGVLKSSELRIDISGGSDFKGKVDVDHLKVDQSGGSDVNISGRATTLSVDASGGSDFNGYDLNTEICDLEASGGSDIEVTASKELSAKASGASDIHYRGKPNVKMAKASGASEVKGKG